MCGSVCPYAEDQAGAAAAATAEADTEKTVLADKLKKAVRKGKQMEEEKVEALGRLTETAAEIAQLNSTLEGLKSSSGAEVAARETALADATAAAAAVGRCWLTPG